MKILNKTIKIFKRIWKELKDWRTLVIFIIVTVILSSEVWVPYLLAVITGKKYFWIIGTTCWAFWLGPGTPFLPLSISLTFLIKGIFNKIKKKRNERWVL